MTVYEKQARKAGCVFWLKKVWEMEMHFVDRNESDFVLKLVISQRERTTDKLKMDTESCKRLIGKKSWNRNFMCNQVFQDKNEFI